MRCGFRGACVPRTSLSHTSYIWLKISTVSESTLVQKKTPTITGRIYNYIYINPLPVIEKPAPCGVFKTAVKNEPL